MLFERLMKLVNVSPYIRQLQHQSNFMPNFLSYF